MLEPRRLLAAGDLDGTFGNGGVVTSPFGSTASSISALALEPDGKIIAAGFTGQGYAIARYNTDGSLDQSFGSGGTVVINSPGSAHHVALEPSGDIIVVGDRNTGTDDTLVARLTSDGALDPSFGTNGQEILNLGGGGSVVIDPFGTVYVGGDLYGTYNVARLNADGSIDTTFGKNGIGSLPAQPFSNGNLHDIALQADGKIVLGGSGGIVVAGPGGVPEAVPDFALVRFNSDGTPDTAFGTGGVVQTTFRGLDNADAMAIQANGKILLAGESGRPSGAGDDLAMARYNSDGTLDSTFGSGGKVLDSLGSDYSMISDLLVEPGGKIVATGQADDSSALFRFNSDGSLDSSFGNQGVVLDPAGAGAIREQPDGKFVVASALFKLERYFGEVPPTTSGISDVSVPENSLATVIALANDFQGGSVPAAQLAYSVTADSNSALFTSTSIDPQTGNLTLNYAANVSGTAQITVRALDPDGGYADTSFQVTVQSASRVSWISNQSGFWDVASNWSTDHVPALGSDVTIDQPGVVVTIRPGDDENVGSLTSAIGTSLDITGGSLTLTDNSLLNGGIDMTGGLLEATGAQISLTVEGSFTVTGASLDAAGGASLILPTLSSYQNPNPSTGTMFQATGAGSTLDLSALDALGPLDSALSIMASGGGHIDLSSLSAIDNSSQTPQVVQISGDGSGSQIDLSKLATFNGGDNSALSVTNNAVFLTPLLSTLSDVNATLDGTDAHVADSWSKFVGGVLRVTGGSYNLAKLSNVDGSTLLVLTGGTLALPDVTTYVVSPANFMADGAGSVLDLSSLTNISQPQPTLSIYATNGGEVNLDALTSFSGFIINDKGNSKLIDDHVTEIAHTVITLDGTDPQVAASWNQFTSGFLIVTGGSYNLPQLTDLDGTNIFVQSGARLALSGVTQLSANQTLLSDGAGSLLDLSNLAAVSRVTGGQQGYLSISAAHGGEIVLTKLTNLTGADNSIEISDTGNSKIRDQNLDSLTGATIWLDGTDPDVAAAWKSVVDGRLIIQGGTYTLTELTTTDFVFLSLNGGASLSLPGPLNLANGSSIVLAGGAALTIAGDLVDNGSITLGPETLLDVGGGFTQSQNATIVVQIGGTPASAQFGRLAVKNTATVAGTLNVALVNGFVPQENEDFRLMTFASASGNFTTVSGVSPDFSLRNSSESLDITTALKDTVDSLQAVTAAALEGTAFAGALATFTDANPLGVPGNFTATIDWGDSSALTTVSGSQISDSAGTFSVPGSHLYAEEESYTLTVTIRDNDGATATVNPVATVADAKLHLTAVAGVNPPSGDASNVLLATFTDDAGNEPVGDYSATIDWGDGATSAGAIALSNGMFQISGSHQYASAGSFTIGVSVKDDGGSMDALVEAANVQLTPHQEYVIAVYHDVLDRAPDPDGLAYWAAKLDQGMPVSSVAQAITHSDEYYAHFVIEPAYLKLLGRAADQAGVTYWIQKMQSGLTDQQLEAMFAASDEFYALAGESDDPAGDADDTTIADVDHDTDWIDAVYKLLLGRNASADDETYWLNQLSSGISRGQVTQWIANSAENDSQIINADYQKYLGRAAEPGGLGYWLNQFTAGEANEDVIAGFTGSPEYYQKRTS